MEEVVVVLDDLVGDRMGTWSHGREEGVYSLTGG